MVVSDYNGATWNTLRGAAATQAKEDIRGFLKDAKRLRLCERFDRFACAKSVPTREAFPSAADARAVLYAA